jgi:hypothetical protein
MAQVTADAVVHPQSEHTGFYDSVDAKRVRDYNTRPAIGRFTLN